VKALRFALGALPRDIRVHEMRVVAAALVVSVAAISAVGFFIDRVEGGMEQRAQVLLGADLVLETDEPVAPRFVERAGAEGLEIASTVSFPSVLVVGDQSQLVQVKAVTRGYPLRGQAFIADEPFAEGRPAQSIPEPGTVWLDPRLFPRLFLRQAGPGQQQGGQQHQCNSRQRPWVHGGSSVGNHRSMIKLTSTPVSRSPEVARRPQRRESS